MLAALAAACASPVPAPETPRIAFAADASPARGPDEAPVRIVEFADFRCGYCARYQPTLARLLAEYPADVRLGFVHMPVVSLRSAPAAIAAEAARRQGKFWPMHDALFARIDTPLDPAALQATALEAGLEADRFVADMRDPALAARVRADLRQVDRLEIRGTPALLINGRLFVGVLSYAELRNIVEEELVAARQRDPALQEALDGTSTAE